MTAMGRMRWLTSPCATGGVAPATSGWAGCGWPTTDAHDVQSSGCPAAGASHGCLKTWPEVFQQGQASPAIGAAWLAPRHADPQSALSSCISVCVPYMAVIAKRLVFCVKRLHTLSAEAANSTHGRQADLRRSAIERSLCRNKSLTWCNLDIVYATCCSGRRSAASESMTSGSPLAE